MTITQNEVLEAIRASIPKSDDTAVTTKEIARALDVSTSTVVRVLGRLVESGAIVVVRKSVEDMGGRRQQVYAYRPATV
jgi:DNA-binding MarR family transcriptional regulator